MTNEKEIKDLESDLVIIGGGGAGLAAAMTAAEKGCKNIIVLEKLKSTGGNFIIFGGIFAAESPAQRRALFVDAARDYYFNLAMRWAHWKIDPWIMRAFIDKSGDTIRWLETKGLIFNVTQVQRNQNVLSFHYPLGKSKDISRGCAEMMQVMDRNTRDLGVKILVNTRAKKILLGDKGQVSGVLAETAGEELQIKTKGVIIATGGFAGNKELLKKRLKNYHENMTHRGLPNTGDGIQLASEIGAAIEDTSTLLPGPLQAVQSEPMMIGSPEPGTFPVTLSNLLWEPYIFFVNKKGKQFMGYDEGPLEFFVERTYAMLMQPEGIAYAIFDDNMRRILEETGNLMNRRLGFREKVEFQPIEELPGLARELRKQADKGKLKMSDSWSEIAGWMNIDPRALQNTIDEYNKACDQGYDPIFTRDHKYLLPLRTPPYYAIECHCYFLDTLGGIKINENMEVLDKQLNPIPGLYAAGSTTSGWEGEVYCYQLCGEARSFALNSGRIAGENAAWYVSV